MGVRVRGRIWVLGVRVQGRVRVWVQVRVRVRVGVEPAFEQDAAQHADQLLRLAWLRLGLGLG